MNLLTEQAVDLRFLEISSGIRRCFDLGFAGGAKTDKSRRHSLQNLCQLFMFLFMHIHSAIRLRKVPH